MGIVSAFMVRSPTRGRRILGVYANPYYPIYVRNGLGLTPVASLFFLLVVGAVTLPVSLASWCILPIPAIWVVYLLVTYIRVPGPFLPSWILGEVTAGRVPLATPDRRDWVHVRNGVITGVLGQIALIYLVAMGAFRRFG